MASTDARPVPWKNAIYRHYFAIRKNDGSLITGWTGADSERSLDGATFADCTNEATEIGSTGIGYLELTATEMNTDATVVKITVTNTGALPYVVTLFPQDVGDIRVNATQIGGQTASASGTVTFPATIASTTNITAGTIATVTNLTNLPVIPANWITAAGITAGALNGKGDWGDATVANQSSIIGFIDTEIGTIISHLTDIKGAGWTTTDTLEAIRDRGDAAWITATGFSTHSAADVWTSVARTLTAATNITSDASAITMSASGVVGTVNLVNTTTTNTDMVAAAPTAAANADAVWDEPIAGHLGAGSTGEALNAAGAGGDPWTTTLPGAYGAGSAGFILGTNLDAVLSARTLAAAAYFDPAADTVATVTTLTNLPAITSNWLTAAGVAADAVTEIQAGLATASAVSTVDTVVDAIKAKTDQLIFTVANQVDANALTGGGGDDAATIYAHFTSGSNEDVFKADVSGIATQASVNTIDGIVDSILIDTAEIGVAGAGLTALATAASVATVDGKIDTIDGIVDAILVDTNELQTDDIPATLATLATASALATAQSDLDIITGSTGVNLLAATQASIDAIEADTSELQTNQGDWATAVGFATGAALANVDGKIDTIDTIADAIKAVTDQFVFTVANQVDANIQYVNDVQLVGTGVLADEWGPA